MATKIKLRQIEQVNEINSSDFIQNYAIILSQLSEEIQLLLSYIDIEEPISNILPPPTYLVPFGTIYVNSSRVNIEGFSAQNLIGAPNGIIVIRNGVIQAKDIHYTINLDENYITFTENNLTENDLISIFCLYNTLPR